jgi:hypothetical protein
MSQARSRSSRGSQALQQAGQDRAVAAGLEVLRLLEQKMSSGLGSGRGDFGWHTRGARIQKQAGSRLARPQPRLASLCARYAQKKPAPPPAFAFVRR